MEHDKERLVRARFLQQEILAHHTYVHRARAIVRLMEHHEPAGPRGLDRAAFALIYQLFAQYVDQKVPA